MISHTTTLGHNLSLIHYCPFFAQSKNLLSGQTFPDRDIYLTNLYYSKHKDILGKRPIKSLHRAPSGRSTCKYPNCNCRKRTQLDCLLKRSTIVADRNGT